MLRHSIRRLQGAVQLPLWIAVRGLSSSPSLLRERSINTVQLLGRVGTDPRLIEFEHRLPLVVFTLATNKPSTSQNEDGTVTETNWVSWHSINVIRPVLQDIVLKFVKKGTRVLVNGRLEYQTKFNDDGTRIRNCNVIADDLVTFYSRPKDSEFEEGEDVPVKEPFHEEP